MIPSLRLPATLTAFAAFLLLGPGLSARAADDDAAARKEAADELLNTLHMSQVVEATSKRMLQSLDGVTDRMEKTPNAKPEQVAAAQALRQELHTMVGQQLNWDAMKADVVQAYADEFSLAELKEVSAFYHTPTGMKIADKQEDLNEKMGKAIQQRSAALIPAIQQKIRATSMKFRPPVPPVAPAAGAPPVPGPMVVSPAVSPAVASPAATPLATPPATPTVPPAAAPTPAATPNP